MSTTRATFDKQLRELQDCVLVLSSMVDKAVGRSIEALKRRDRQEAERIIADDALVNKKRFEIEEHCMELIVTQQPMAGDLRFIITVLHIATDLERMGDHAEGIAKINILMGDEPLLKPLVDIPRMAERGREMLRSALDAFIARDAEAARRVAEGDDDIDNLYDQVYRELLTYMLSDPRTISRATHLLWVAHNLERFADRVTNICERVVFNVTGRIEEMNKSDARG